MRLRRRQRKCGTRAGTVKTGASARPHGWREAGRSDGQALTSAGGNAFALSERFFQTSPCCRAVRALFANALLTARSSTGLPDACAALGVSARASPSPEANGWVGETPLTSPSSSSNLSVLMPSRQERRKAERDAAKRAPAQAGAAGAAGAAAALANLRVHPDGDWATQAADPEVGPGGISWRRLPR